MGTLYIWAQACERWQAEGKHRAPGTIRRELEFFRWARPRIHSMPLESITRRMLLELREGYRGELNELGEPRSNRSANYMAGALLAVLRAAVDWEWLAVAPARLKKLPEAPPRDRWLTPEQAETLIDALPSLVGQMARLAVETGLRKSNVSGLVWAWVDMSRHQLVIPGKVMKARAPLVVPLSPLAVAVLAAREDARLAGCGWVFHTDGRQMTRPDAGAWRSVLKRQGIADFRWHDLRHTWASWMAQAGTRTAVLKQLGGWKTLAMVDRYTHLDTRQSREAVVRAWRWRSPMQLVKRAA